MTRIRRPAQPVQPGDVSAPTAPGAAATVAAPAPSALPPDRFERSPTEAQLANVQDPQLRGYRWMTAEVDAVLHRFAIGDARLLLRTAVALDNGDQFLRAAELEAAARGLSAQRMAGYRWSPTALAAIMTRTGLASETALLAEARRQDDGDRQLSPAELEAAARVVQRTVPANNVAAIRTRVAELGQHPRVERQQLGQVQGETIEALRIRRHDGSQPARLKVLISAGVHGDEPCGPPAALLLVEQLLARPGFRDLLDIVVVPLVNPRGLAAGSRRTPEDVDLNRVMGTPDAPEEARIVGDFMEQEGFDLVLDLHSGEARRGGFWVLHDGAEGIMRRAMERFDDRWPALHGDTRPYVLSAPGVGISDNPATLKGHGRSTGARWAATLEAPASVSYHDQVFGENELVNLILAEALRQKITADAIA